MKILIADDSPVIRAAVTSVLKAEGHSVQTAEDGIAAIQAFYADLPDLVILDIQMPGMSGYLACRMIKEDPDTSDIPVLILTARSAAEDRYWSEKSGADGYLTKETLADTLVPAVRAAGASRALAELSGRAAGSKNLDKVDVMYRITALLDRKLFETTVVNDLITVGSRAGDLRSVAAESLMLLGKVIDFHAAALLVPRAEAMAVLAAGDHDRKSISSAAFHQLELHGGSVPRREEWEIWNVVEASGSRDGGPFQSMLALPLRARNDLVALLVIAAHGVGAFPTPTIRTLRLIESPLAAVVGGSYHYQQLVAQEARLSLAALSGPH